MQQLQADPLREPLAHMQVLGSKVRFLVVRLLVLLTHEQFNETNLVKLFVWLTQLQF